MDCSPPFVITTFKQPALQYVPRIQVLLSTTYGRFPEVAISITHQLETRKRHRMLRPRTFPPLSPPTVWSTSPGNRCVMPRRKEMKLPAPGGEELASFTSVSRRLVVTWTCTQQYYLVPSALPVARPVRCDDTIIHPPDKDAKTGEKHPGSVFR